MTEARDFHYQLIQLPRVRGVSRTAAESEMGRFVIIVNGFQPLTIITKRSVLDVAAVLDPPLRVPATLSQTSAHEKWKLIQKQPSRVVLRKSCSENMQEIYRRTSRNLQQISFIEITRWHGCCPVNLLHIFRTLFLWTSLGGCF